MIYKEQVRTSGPMEPLRHLQTGTLVFLEVEKVW